MKRDRRRLPFSLALRVDEPLVAPLRDMPQSSVARIEREDGEAVEWGIEAADGVPRELPDGRYVSERRIRAAGAADRPLPARLRTASNAR